MSSNKVKAFTISEILIVLVITSIVVALAFSILTLVTKQLQVIGKRYETSTEVGLLKQRLILDFEKATYVYWDDIEEQLTVTIDTEEYAYAMAGKNISRDEDTLMVRSYTSQYFYQGSEVEEGIVDALLLTIDLYGNGLPIFVSRRISAQETMKAIWE